MTSQEAKKLRRIVANIVKAELDLVDPQLIFSSEIKELEKVKSNAYRHLNLFIQQTMNTPDRSGVHPNKDEVQ